MTSDRQHGPSSDINVTPLVDVVLVLLIIFMVVTPLLQVHHDADRPSIDGTPGQREDIRIAIASDASVSVNDLPTRDGADLARVLTVLASSRTTSERIAFVSGAESLAFGEVVAVMDVARGAGIDRVGLIDAP